MFPRLLFLAVPALLAATAARAWLPETPAAAVERAREAASQDGSALPGSDATPAERPGRQALQGFLRRMRERQTEGEAFTVVFDLDDTVVDPGRRLLARFEEYTGKIERRLSSEEIETLRVFRRRAAEDSSLLDYDIGRTLERLEVGDRRTHLQARMYSGLNFGRDLELDEALPGVQAMLEAVARAGGTIAYVTDRPESLREATLASLRRLGLPEPDGERVRIYLSPRLNDRGHKDRAYAAIRAGLPPVLAGFENHSGHAAAFGATFPEAMSFFLTTRDPAGGEPPPAAALIPYYSLE